MKPRKFTTEAIILSRKNYSEADRILTVYSKHYGKLGLLAKGVRKVKSRKRGHLEIFSHIKFSAVRGKDMDFLSEAELLNPLHNIRNDLKKVTVAYFFMEAIRKLTQNEEKNEELFTLLLGYLGTLSSSEKFLKELRMRFVTELLVLLGYWPSGKIMDNPDNILRDITEREMWTTRVGKRILQV